ncbi:sirohydrochlorin chelatase [Malaciobacter molluscorum]|uniref:sirohydrochlorin chelatase n=1 Tax=Malaciobacter molluscorum TaxID=1032072 RepID=UPI0018C87B0C|nr:CbiX/SirB N-terminal domain-containing protein [Malaciobacter molluscorum]
MSISYAFLELAEPTIEESIKTQIKKGSKKIIILPYFLAQGKHVKTDIPNEINKLKNIFNNVDFVLLEHLGANDMIIDLILSIVDV